ncbi:MAG: C-GCAxxG-C-C family protein [Candidatus Thorarchaeota archaeon]
MASKVGVMNLAKAYAVEGFLCSESVLLALSKTLRIESDIIPRIATGFGGGIGRHGEICGALSGAIMGLGLQFGRSHPSETPDSQTPYEYSQIMMNLFISRFGQIRCKDLLGIDISCKEGLQRYRREKLWETKCQDIIKITSGLAYDLLEARGADLNP